MALLVRFEVCSRECRQTNTHTHVAGGMERRAGRDRGETVTEQEREMARGHPWVICFGPLRVQTHREQVNQLQCDMNH